MENLLRDPKTCFEVDIPLSYLDTGFDAEMPPCSVGMFYHSVIIRGRAEVVEGHQEKLSALNALMASHEKRPGYNGITGDMKPVDIRAVVAVRIDSVSGKENLAQSKTEGERGRIADYLQERSLPGDREAAALIRPR